MLSKVPSSLPSVSASLKLFCFYPCACSIPTSHPILGVLPGLRLSGVFFSYRAMDGRTHVKQKRAGFIRRATLEEIYGHGQWSNVLAALLMPNPTNFRFSTS